MKTAPSKRRQPAQDTASTVRFELPFLEAREVFLAGTFNEWHPSMFPMIEAPGGWMKDLVLTPGTYEYLFVVDGRWIADPNNSRAVSNPFGGVNSVIEVPTPTRPRPRRARPKTVLPAP